MIHILQRTKPLENFVQHCDNVTWRWHHIWPFWRHQKCHLQSRTDI